MLIRIDEEVLVGEQMIMPLVFLKEIKFWFQKE